MKPENKNSLNFRDGQFVDYSNPIQRPLVIDSARTDKIDVLSQMVGQQVYK